MMNMAALSASHSRPCRSARTSAPGDTSARCSKEPTGTPMTLARVRPPIMRPMARAEFRCPAAVVATTAPVRTGQVALRHGLVR